MPFLQRIDLQWEVNIESNVNQDIGNQMSEHLNKVYTYSRETLFNLRDRFSIVKNDSAFLNRRIYSQPKTEGHYMDKLMWWESRGNPTILF